MASDETDATAQQGSRVRIQDGDGQERVVLLRDDDDESWAWDSVSLNTPLARAIIGRRAGEEVEVVLHEALPVRKVTILAIEDARAGGSGS